MITKTSGSLITDFSSNMEVVDFINTKTAELNITRSALVRFGLLLAAKRLAGKEADKARKIIIKEA